MKVMIFIGFHWRKVRKKAKLLLWRKLVLLVLDKKSPTK